MKTPTKPRLRWLMIAMVTAWVWSGTAPAAERLHPHTLCPLSGSLGQTILLIDTTDPLAPLAQERLRQLVVAFRDPDNIHYLKPAHELLVYRLTPELEDMGKPLQVCNPGDPRDRTWKDDLVSGAIPVRRMWRRFEAKVLHAIPDTATQSEGKYSPLLESLALIAARHIPVIGVSDATKPTRLIMFSDMLQNSESLSHYLALPDMETFRNLAGYTDMRAELGGVDVWIFYVQRGGLQHYQTAEHYHWWTRVTELFGGRLIEQVPL